MEVPGWPGWPFEMLGQILQPEVTQWLYLARGRQQAIPRGRGDTASSYASCSWHERSLAPGSSLPHSRSVAPTAEYCRQKGSFRGSGTCCPREAGAVLGDLKPFSEVGK